jgi:hypothetical protein
LTAAILDFGFWILDWGAAGRTVAEVKCLVTRPLSVHKAARLKSMQL